MLEMCPHAFAVNDYSIVIKEELDSIVEVLQVPTRIQYEPLHSLARGLCVSLHKNIANVATIDPVAQPEVTLLLHEQR